MRAPEELAKYIARKGSITVNGVSLTVNAWRAEFEINLIPHTLSVTTLRHLKPGSRVNLEVDLIARYIERLLRRPSRSGGPKFSRFFLRQLVLDRSSPFFR